MSGKKKEKKKRPPKPKRWREKKATPCGYRLLEPRDVSHSMMPMLEEWRVEHLREKHELGLVNYPWMKELSVQEYAVQLATDIAENPRFIHVGAVVGYSRDAEQRVLGGKVKGFLVGRVIRRNVGEPKVLFLAEMLYVDPAFRTRRIAARLIAVVTRLLRERLGVEQLEAAWTPGTHAAQIWESVGFVPYLVQGAFVTPAGETRTDDVPFDRAAGGAAWGASSEDQAAAAAPTIPAGHDPPSTTSSADKTSTPPSTPEPPTSPTASMADVSERRTEPCPPTSSMAASPAS